MSANARALPAPKLTLSLAAVLSVSVIFNVFAVRDQYLRPRSTGTADASTVAIQPGSERESIIDSAQRKDAVRLQQIADLRSDIAMHLNTVAQLHRERVSLLTKNSQTEQKLALTSQQLATAQQKLTATREAARRVGSRANMRVRGAIKRQFASAPSKLVPILGNGVAVGSFGYDVYELCASMSDLAELNRAIGEPVKEDGVIDTMCRAGKQIF